MHLPRRGAWSTKSERRLPTRPLHLRETRESTRDQPRSAGECAAARRQRKRRVVRSRLKPPTHRGATHLPRRGPKSAKTDRRLLIRDRHLHESCGSTCDQPTSRRECAAAQLQRACRPGRYCTKPPTHSDAMHLPRRGAWSSKSDRRTLARDGHLRRPQSASRECVSARERA
eukprot:5107868-Prymnesium_polylepis.1